MSRKDLIEHFCKVNGCSEEFLEHEEGAFEVWRKRSLRERKQDFGERKKYIAGSVYETF